MKTLALIITLLSLAACASPQKYGPDSPHYAYPGGARFILNHPLEVEPGSATVRLQFGKIVARNAVQEVEPHCIFEVNSVRDMGQQIQPDSFDITAVRRSVTTFSGMPAYFAAMRAGFDRDGGPSHIYYKTEFRLRSARQPDVRAMTCQSNQMAPGIAIMRHVTLPEIRQALGGVFTLALDP
jgi:hypothetical protein